MIRESVLLNLNKVLMHVVAPTETRKYIDKEGNFRRTKVRAAHELTTREAIQCALRVKLELLDALDVSNEERARYYGAQTLEGMLKEINDLVVAVFDNKEIETYLSKREVLSRFA